MLTFIFCVLMIVIFGKIGITAFRLSWSLIRITLSLVLLPLLLIGLVLKGLIKIAIPVLAIIGLFSLLDNKKK